MVTNTAPGGPENLTVDSSAVPEPGSNDVLIETEYCAINFPDLLMTTADYQLRPPLLPFTLGSEAIGKVVQRGSSVTSLQVGDIVHALTWHGAFTTHLILDAGPFQPRADAINEVKSNVTSSTILRAPLKLVPPDFNKEEVVALGFAYSAAYHALKDRASLVAGERLLVLGASGGLGLAAIQIALAIGATVVAVSRKEHERALCRRQGDAVTTIVYEQLFNADWRKSDEARFDVVFDVLGKEYTEPAIKTLVPGGRLLVVGFVAGDKDIPKIKTNLLLLRECKLVGSAWGSWASREPSVHSANLDTLYSWLHRREIHPVVSKVYPLEDAAKALMAMRSGDIQGKVLLKNSSWNLNAQRKP